MYRSEMEATTHVADANLGHPCTEGQGQKVACTKGQFRVRRNGC